MLSSIICWFCEGYIAMASSKVVRYSRQESLHKEPSPSVDSSTTSDSSDGEKDLALDDFDFIKTIGECWCDYSLQCDIGVFGSYS